jgi:lipopolysaccharide biosynthesis glycosyltransferase
MSLVYQVSSTPCVRQVLICLLFSVRFGHGIKIIHFIGSVKPWHHQLTSTGLVFLKPGTYSSQASVVDYIQIWWNHYARVTDFLSGSKGQSVEQYTDELRKAAWSRGQPDYMGQDRFDNIQAKLDASLQSKPPPSQKGKTSSSAGETKKEEIQEIQITF